MAASILAPGIAQAYHDTQPQTDLSAETLKQAEFRLGLWRFEVGVTDDVQLGLMPLPYFVRVKNLMGKWRYFHDEDVSLSAGAGMFWFNLQDFKKDAANVTFFCFPLQTAFSWHASPDVRYHLGLTYTAIGTKGEGGGEDTDLSGVAVVSTATLHPTLEIVSDNISAFVVDAQILLFQRLTGNADERIMLDDFTTLDMHQEARADLKTGFQAFLGAGGIWSWETFNLRFLVGYGHYPVSVLGFYLADPIPMVDFDFYWRF